MNNDLKLSDQVFLYFLGIKKSIKMFEQFTFTIFSIFYVHKGFNFYLKELLNPFIFVSNSETILEYFCPDGFAQSVHACFNLENYFKILLSRRVAGFNFRKYFRILLSRKFCSICLCLL